MTGCCADWATNWATCARPVTGVHGLSMTASSAHLVVTVAVLAYHRTALHPCSVYGWAGAVRDPGRNRRRMRHGASTDVAGASPTCVRGASSGRGSSRSAARRSSAWPVARISIYKRLTVLVRDSGSIRTTDTSLERSVKKDCRLCGLTRRSGWQRILFLVRKDGREARPHGPADLAPCRREKRKALFGLLVQRFRKRWRGSGAAPQRTEANVGGGAGVLCARAREERLLASAMFPLRRTHASRHVCPGGLVERPDESASGDTHAA
jgi:hypothetical protein